MVEFRTASYDEVKDIKAVAKQHKYTNHFSHPAYCNKTKFQKGEIVVAILESKIVGFAALRIKKRIPETEVDIIGVDSDFRSNGVGKALLEFVFTLSNNKSIVLNVKNDNPRAIDFYKKCGFVDEGFCMDGTAQRFRKLSPTNKKSWLC